MATEERKPQLDFWFDFASTYSYLSACRIEQLAQAATISVRWRPFLLGPIFAAQGWETSPFNIYKAKGAYMLHDVGRQAKHYGEPFTMPATFPARSVAAARIAYAWPSPATLPDFCRAVFRLQFAEGRDIADQATLDTAITTAGETPRDIAQTLQEPDVKTRLRAATQEAIELDIFGAPIFVTPTGDRFWGDDRLERAIAETSGILQAQGDH